MIGRLQEGERYTSILVYTKLGKSLSYETLLLTEADLRRLRDRADKNPQLELERPQPLHIIIWRWIQSKIRRSYGKT